MPDEHSQPDGVSHIGERAVFGEYLPFGLNQKDRAQHVYCIGTSGTGKTTLLRNLLVQDIEAGKGVALIDVHGDLARELLDYIPSQRLGDVLYFNPADTLHPVAFNPFYGVDSERRHVVASNIVGAFKGIFRDSWGPRMEYVMYAAVATLLECPHTTLLGLQRIFTDEAYRKQVLTHVDDPMLLEFWKNEFGMWDKKFRNDVVAPIQNKVGPLLMTPIMRNIVGQVKSSIDFRDIMDNSKIFIANLNKGGLGEDKANLLGSLLIAESQYAALSRADVDVDDRIPFNLCVDEFQNFQTDSFATILSEARKYGLSLVLSHQFAKQLKEEIADAVFGNVGTIITFRVGAEDAERLSREFGATFPPKHFTLLSNRHICVKMLVDGNVMEPFQGKTVPPIGIRHGWSRRLIKLSRQNYGVKREIVEYKHAKWLKS